LVQKPIESLVGLIFLRFFKFVCEKSCPRLDIGRMSLDVKYVKERSFFGGLENYIQNIQGLLIRAW